MSIDNLVELQEIDTKLKDLSDLLGDLPSKIDQLDLQEQSTKDTLLSNKSRLKELEVEMHKREVDVDQVNGKVNKLKDQLFLVTNNKQYDALMLEIDHLKDQRSSFETESLEFLEEKETLTSSVTSMESELGDLTQDLSNRRVKLESAIADSAVEKKSLDSMRDNHLSGIDSNIISTYEKVKNHREGLGVVEISGGACGGCGAHVPPQVITEVRAKEGLHSCDVCGRFLYNNTKIDH
ncbi:MAG: zinc ribbon domain-containing protein [Fidelibacterota bacterium]|jgi:predicted  nucleic acid-binding Zn-ribbon protein